MRQILLCCFVLIAFCSRSYSSPYYLDCADWGSQFHEELNPDPMIAPGEWVYTMNGNDHSITITYIGRMKDHVSLNYVSHGFDRDIDPSTTVSGVVKVLLNEKNQGWIKTESITPLLDYHKMCRWGPKEILITVKDKGNPHYSKR